MVESTKQQPLLALQATLTTVESMREGCHSKYTWGSKARQAVAQLVRQAPRRLQPPEGKRADNTSVSPRGGQPWGWRECSGSSSGSPGSMGDSEAAAAGLAAVAGISATHNFEVLPSWCPMFARKIAAGGAAEWEKVLRPILEA